MLGDELTILAIDDSQDSRDLYAMWLGEDHSVLLAPDGSTGLAELDESVDIVLVDRDMPGLSGMAVAEGIAAGDHDPYVAMVSSMRVDFDIVDVPIDDYVQKPVTQADLGVIVEQYLAQRAYRSALDEFFSLTAKLAALEAELTESELRASDRYEGLKRRVAEKRREVDDAISTPETDWTVAFKTCGDRDGVGVRSPNV